MVGDGGGERRRRGGRREGAADCMNDGSCIGADNVASLHDGGDERGEGEEVRGADADVDGRLVDHRRLRGDRGACGCWEEGSGGGGGELGEAGGDG